MKDLFYLSKRLGTSWSNRSLPIRCLHVWHSWQSYLWKADAGVQRRWLHWWSWSKSIGSWGKKAKTKKEAAEQIGRDVVHFGLGERKNQRARKINDRDKCNPPTKKQRSDAKTLEKRTNTAKNESAVMKIRKAKIINSFKREYVVSSATGKAQYVVSISNVPTCTCQDLQINGERVICKHIIFVLLNALKLKDDTILSKI